MEGAEFELVWMPFAGLAERRVRRFFDDYTVLESDGPILFRCRPIRRCHWDQTADLSLSREFDGHLDNWQIRTIDAQALRC